MFTLPIIGVDLLGQGVTVQNSIKRWTVLVGTMLLVTAGLVSFSTRAGATSLSPNELIQTSNRWIAQNKINTQVSSSILVLDRVISTRDGLTTVRYHQEISGFPVLNSLVAITLNSDGIVISHNSQISSSTSLPPRLSKAQAKELIVSGIAERWKVPTSYIAVNKLEPVLFDPQLSASAIKKATVLWRAEVVKLGNVLSSSIALLNDASSKLTSLYSTVQQATQPNYPTPLVCDLQASQTSSQISLSSLGNKYVGKAAEYPLCAQSSTARISSSSSAVGSIQETTDYYWKYLGVDIAAERYLGNVAPAINFGKNVDAKSYCDAHPTDSSCVPAISGFTNVCSYNAQGKSVDCPMENAFWVPWNSTDCHSGACSGIFFGRGFDIADDVVAHELTHGVTYSDAFPNGICDPSNSPTCDANSVSEALSDWFGQAVDLLNPSANKSPDPNWNMGEAVNGGPFRNMAMVGSTSPCGTSDGWVPVKQIDRNWDNSCDAHTNLGPADRFAWLISNGGSQNRITVKPIGTTPWVAGKYQLCNTNGDNCTAIVNMTRLGFQALVKLNGDINYTQFGQALLTSCSDLTKAKTNPFPATYCTQVKNALAATGIAKVSLNLTKKPTIAKSKTPITVAGKLIATNTVENSGVRSTSVLLQFKSTTATTWTTLKTMTTSTLGVVSSSVIFPKSGSYRLVTSSTSAIGNYSSPIIKITVR